MFSCVTSSRWLFVSSQLAQLSLARCGGMQHPSGRISGRTPQALDAPNTRATCKPSPFEPRVRLRHTAAGIICVSMVFHWSEICLFCRQQVVSDCLNYIWLSLTWGLACISYIRIRPESVALNVVVCSDDNLFSVLANKRYLAADTLNCADEHVPCSSLCTPQSYTLCQQFLSLHKASTWVIQFLDAKNIWECWSCQTRCIPWSILRVELNHVVSFRYTWEHQQAHCEEIEAVATITRVPRNPSGMMKQLLKYCLVVSIV